MAPPTIPSIHLHPVQQLPIDQLMKAPWNANVVPPETLEKIRTSLRRYGSVENSVVRPSWCRGTRTALDLKARRDTLMGDASSFETLSGNHRLGIYREEGVTVVPCVVVELADPDAQVLAQVLNRTRGADDPTLRDALLRDVATTMPVADIASLLPQTPQDISRLLGNGPGALEVDLPSGTTGDDYVPVPMTEQFVVPPFSVLDMRQGYWRKRKQAWLARGVCATEARGDVLPTQSEGANPALSDQATHGVFRRRATGGKYTGASSFDPVVCELAVRWFCPANGVVLDPFAGGSTAGMVAATLGRSFIGIDLQEAQVVANRQRAEERLGDTNLPMPRWLVGDSCELLQITEGKQADLVFTCPPYADLEQYSNDPRDISTMEYPEFLATYREILASAVAQLRPDRFAVAVVGEVRDENGRYRNFVGDTVAAFEAAGASFYNEAILVTPVGSLPMRAGRFFRGSRKLGKQHQQMLVFVKGDPVKATEACGVIEVSLPKEGSGTAMARTKLSRPMRVYRERKLLQGDVLDFGAGHDPHEYAKWDPAHHPDASVLERRYHTICCNYVLNVLPTEDDRRVALDQIKSLLLPGGKLLLSVYRAGEEDQETSKGFQCGWDQDRWAEFLSEAGWSLTPIPDLNGWEMEPAVSAQATLVHVNASLRAAGVGKRIGRKVYAHASALEEWDVEALQPWLDALPAGWDYQVVKLHLDTGAVTFIQSPQFDAVEEPAVGDAHIVRDGEAKFMPAASDPYIYHHKWRFVRASYAGFSTKDSQARSRSWENLGLDLSRIGKLSYWAAHALPRLSGAGGSMAPNDNTT